MSTCYRTSPAIQLSALSDQALLERLAFSFEASQNVRGAYFLCQGNDTLFVQANYEGLV
jgi:hypothetical protein